MSRNFELLHEAGRAQDMLRQRTEQQRAPISSSMPSISPPALFVPSAPALPIEDAARIEVTKLVHRLFLDSEASGSRQVVFTGTEPGNGCTWICAHAADILASQAGASVCVVDCDLNFPTLHEEFGVPNRFGLANALQGTEPIRQFVQQLSHPNLWLLSCGSMSDDMTPQQSLERMGGRMAELRSEFDYVLLDVAPLNSSNHGIVLGSWCDGVALVLKANSSSRRGARKSVEDLRAAKVPLLGAILNQRTFPIPQSIYSRL